MAGKVGDRISLDSKKAGQARREGVILEVIESAYGVRYEVRWADGHQSGIQPTGGSAQIIPAPTEANRKDP
jgi:Domain of unknown function (DUF1918)